MIPLAAPLFTAAISALSGVGRSTISLLRQVVADEVASLNNPKAVKSVSVEGEVVSVVLDTPGGEQVVKLGLDKMAGLAKTQRIIDRTGAILPTSISGYANQLIRVMIEVSIMVFRKKEVK